MQLFFSTESEASTIFLLQQLILFLPTSQNSQASAVSKCIKNSLLPWQHNKMSV